MISTMYTKMMIFLLTNIDSEVVSMASVLGKEIPKESQFMTEYWRFRKQFYIPEDNDEYWNELVNAADSLMHKYDPELIKNPNKKSHYKNIVLSCVDEIETRYRKEAANEQH